MSAEEAQDQLVDWASTWSMEHALHEKLCKLSHAEMRLLSLAPLMLWEPEVVVLDEPLVCLGPEEARNVADFLGGLRQKSAILATAAVSSALYGIADRIVDLDGRGS